MGPAYGASAELGGRCSRSCELKYPLAVESQFYGQGSEQRGGDLRFTRQCQEPRTARILRESRATRPSSPSKLTRSSGSCRIPFLVFQAQHGPKPLIIFIFQPPDFLHAGFLSTNHDAFANPEFYGAPNVSQSVARWQGARADQRALA